MLVSRVRARASGEGGAGERGDDEGRVRQEDCPITGALRDVSVGVEHGVRVLERGVHSNVKGAVTGHGVFDRDARSESNSTRTRGC